MSLGTSGKTQNSEAARLRISNAPYSASAKYDPEFIRPIEPDPLLKVEIVVCGGKIVDSTFQSHQARLTGPPFTNKV